MFENLLQDGTCSKCGHSDTYECAIDDANGEPWCVENCYKCNAEGQFFIKVA